MIQLTRPYFSKLSINKISKSIPEILKSGNLMMGKWNEKFEKNFAKNIKIKHSLTINTCTSAIQIALEYYKVKGFDVDKVKVKNLAKGITNIKV